MLSGINRKILRMEQCKINKDLTCSEEPIEAMMEMIHNGWACESLRYHATRHAKERSQATSSVRLQFLGAVRAFVVDQLFRCGALLFQDTSASYTAPGSNNPTSDYDVNILSRMAPDIMNYMLMNFYQYYSNTMVNAFDTNLYVLGRFSAVGARPPKQVPAIREVAGESSIYIVPTLAEDFQHSFNWAAIALLDTDFIPRDQRLLFVLAIAKQNQARSQARLKTKPNTTQRVYETYTLYYDWCRKVYEVLYGTADPVNLFELVCEAGSYAIEAYVTPSTYNIVVLGMQVGVPIHSTTFDHVIAAIENFGSFVHHMRAELEEVYTRPMTLVLLQKYSKYILRFYYCLLNTSIQKDHDLENIVHLLKTIVSRRDESPENIDFSAMDYNHEETLSIWFARVHIAMSKALEYAWVRALDNGPQSVGTPT
jgi:hypothetical protein